MDERFNELFNLIIKIMKTPRTLIEKTLNNIIFYCQGVRGYGIGIPVNNKFKFFKGSKVSKFLYDSVKKSNNITIEKLITKGILKEKEEFFEFIDTYIVTSPSAASKLILGRHTNGWTEWKTYKEDLLYNFRNKDIY